MAFDSGGIGEAIAHGGTGLLVAPGDEAALLESVAGLLDHPEEMREMGARARKHVLDSFGAGKMVETTVRLYSRVLDGQTE